MARAVSKSVPATLAGALLVLGLGGCIIHQTPDGDRTVTRTSPFRVTALPSAAPQPPPGFTGTPGQERPVDGQYAGVGRVLTNPGARCSSEIPISGWQVSGDQVRFQGFRGTIQPDGSLRMQAGPNFIVGTFFGSHFSGHFWRPQPDCTFLLTLNPVAG